MLEGDEAAIEVEDWSTAISCPCQEGEIPNTSYPRLPFGASLRDYSSLSPLIPLSSSSRSSSHSSSPALLLLLLLVQSTLAHTPGM